MFLRIIYTYLILLLNQVANLLRMGITDQLLMDMLIGFMKKNSRWLEPMSGAPRVLTLLI